METHVHEWLSLLVKWLHVIAGVAWIGASFYFNWLENALDRSEGQRKGLAGHLWAIHGGGFYYLEKYKVAPEKLPKTLHWFKWEAYFTWITGMALLAIIYYWNADAFLIHKDKLDLTPWNATGISLGSLVVAWFVYDIMCKSPLVERPTAFALLGLGLLIASAFGYTAIYSARGAYIHVGALIGTLMAANVFRVIIPSQKALVNAAEKGELVDPSLGVAAGRRSRHNNYLTLPLLFIMISNHYPSTFENNMNWIVLSLLMIAGGGVRLYFNVRNTPEKKVWILPVALAAFVGAFAMTVPKEKSGQLNQDVSFLKVAAIFEKRCLSCHSSQATDDIFTVAPNGVVFDTVEQIRAKLDLIKNRVVDVKNMPLANKTEMTDEERALIGQWIDSGAGI